MTRSTIGAAIVELARRDPGAPAVRDVERALDRAGLVDEARRVATVLAAHGVRRDDLVTVRMPNSVDFVSACVAVWLLGATPQPLVRRLPLDEQRAVVTLADSRVVVGADAGEFPGRTVLPDRIPIRDVEPWHGPDLAAASWKAPTSSGSTGRPKIVLATASAHVDPDGRVAEFVPRAAVQLVAGPLAHSAPFTYAMRGLTTGHSLVVLPRFDAAAALAAIEAHRVTWAMLVPTMLHRMLRLPDAVRAAADLSSLEQVLHIGARIAPATKRGWIDWIGPQRVVEVYAGSESSGLTMIRGDEWLARPGSVGRPISGTELRVVDAAGRELPAGEVGLVRMRRPGPVPFRYLGAEPDVVDGWHTLGDLGSVDADGWLTLVDRADDLVVTGGVKVAPADVEHGLEAHPDVRSAVAVGVPDDDLGQRVHAVVDVGHAAVDVDALLAWARDHLGEWAPRSIEVVREPVRDDAGKVRRRAWATRVAGAR